MKLPLRQALLTLLIATLSLSAPVLLGWFYYRSVVAKRAVSARYTLQAIVQTGPIKEAIQTELLAELLGLSTDQPTNLFELDIAQAEQALRAFPLVKNVTIKRLPPHALYIDYTIRRPVALLYNYTNTGIDEEGYLFPLYPLIKPKNLPEFYFSQQLFAADQPVPWGTQLKGEEVSLGIALLNFFQAQPWQSIVRVRRIDVAHAFAQSFGRREVVVFLEDREIEAVDGRPVTYLSYRLLRLPTKQYAQALEHYLILRNGILNPKHPTQQMALTPDVKSTVPCRGVVLDLRFPQMAFYQFQK